MSTRSTTIWACLALLAGNARAQEPAPPAPNQEPVQEEGTQGGRLERSAEAPLSQSGDRITASFQGQDLAAVLEMFATTYGLNLVYGPDVKGSVTVNLFDAPVDEALRQILATNGYRLEDQNGFLVISPITAADQAAQDNPAASFVSRIYFLDHMRAEDVAKLAGPLLGAGEKIVAGPASSSGLDNTSDLGGNDHASREMFLLLASPQTQEKIAALVKEIDIPPRQVLVEATILSVSLNDNSKLGVDFTALGGIDFQAMGGTSDVTDSVSGGTVSGGQLRSWNVGATQRGFTTPGSPGLHIGILRNQLGVFIEALEEVGNATVLSNPQVLTINRHAAQVLIGQRLGYLTQTSTETSTIQAVQFLEVGTSLVFRPFISSDGWIRMEIHPENSTGSINPGTGLPDESTTEVTTNIMVKDGNTVVLGGLMEKGTTTTTSQVPLLGSLPLIGSLFRSESETEERREIIVLLTPHIVNSDELQQRSDDLRLRMNAAQARLAESHSGYLRPSFARRMYAEAGAALATGDPEVALGKAEWGLRAMPADPDLAALAEHCEGEIRARAMEQRELQDAVELLDELHRQQQEVGPDPGGEREVENQEVEK